MLFPTPEERTLLDSFGRNEKPLSDAGQWTVLPWLADTGECTTAEGWNPKLAAAVGEVNPHTSGAYWNPGTFLRPALCVALGERGEVTLDPTHEWSLSLWACLDPGTQSGYRVTQHNGLCTLEKCVGGVFTTLGEGTLLTDFMGITVSGGKVRVWSGGEVPTVVLEVSDETFTTGHVGIEGTDVYLEDFLFITVIGHPELNHWISGHNTPHATGFEVAELPGESEKEKEEREEEEGEKKEEEEGKLIQPRAKTGIRYHLSKLKFRLSHEEWEGEEEPEEWEGFTTGPRAEATIAYRSHAKAVGGFPLVHARARLRFQTKARAEGGIPLKRLEVTPFPVGITYDTTADAVPHYVIPIPVVEVSAAPLVGTVDS